jgi:uncharacterized cupin superfamily protein
MADVTVKRVEEIDFYKGPNAIAGIKFHVAGRALGVTAWGMNILELAPGATGHPEHDHTRDGQEEVYVVLAGSGVLRVGDEEWPLTPGTLARCGPTARRKLLPGPGGVTVLALGATPGKRYEPRW